MVAPLKKGLYYTLSFAFFVFSVFTLQNRLKNVFRGACCVSLGNLRNPKYVIKPKNEQKGIAFSLFSKLAKLLLFIYA